MGGGHDGMSAAMDIAGLIISAKGVGVGYAPVH